MSDSPISRLLDAVDLLDPDRAVGLLAPDGQLLTVDGRRAQGREAMRSILAEFFSSLRSTSHTVTAEWHLDGVWIAELDASYELLDQTRVDSLPRAVIIRDGPEGFADVRIYGAHEHRLSEEGAAAGGFWIGSHWLPPL